MKEFLKNQDQLIFLKNIEKELNKINIDKEEIDLSLFANNWFRAYYDRPIEIENITFFEFRKSWINK